MYFVKVFLASTITTLQDYAEIFLVLDSEKPIKDQLKDFAIGILKTEQSNHNCDNLVLTCRVRKINGESPKASESMDSLNHKNTKEEIYSFTIKDC